MSFSLFTTTLPFALVSDVATETQKSQGSYSENEKCAIRGQLWKICFKWPACHHIRPGLTSILSSSLACYSTALAISFDAANPYLNLSHTFCLKQ